MSGFRFLASLALCATLLCACSQALQRGMLDNAYISTARPSITVAVNNLPLLEAGRATYNLNWTGMMGGLPIEMWIAIYGEGGLAPMAITTQAQTPQDWFWDSITPRPFSVDESTAAFNGVTYTAWSYIVDPAKDPFGALVTGVRPDGQPQLWIARAFAARYNFNNDKIILEYREPLPEGITSLENLPLGYGNFLLEFAQRAKNAFTVSDGPKDPAGVKKGYIQGIQWQYMSQNYLGTVSRYEMLNSD